MQILNNVMPDKDQTVLFILLHILQQQVLMSVSKWLPAKNSLSSALAFL